MKATGQNILMIAMLLVFPLFSQGQGVGINVAGNPPDGAAVLDVSSTTRGLLTPRMTQAERDAIAGPATGLLIYQTDEQPGFRFYDGTEWLYLRGRSTLPGTVNIEPGCAVSVAGPPGAGLGATYNCTTGSGTVTWGGGDFDHPPAVNLSSSVVPVPPPAPDIYCIPNYSAPCNVSFNADQITGVRVQESTAGPLGPWTMIMQNLSACDNPGGGNYVEVPPSTATCTMEGNTGGGGCADDDNWYRIEIQSSTEWNDRVQAWIDWNADGDFFDDQEHIAPVCDFGLSGTGGAFLSSSPFQVPSFALNGNTVMRCRSIWTASCNPCLGGTFGETEDYTITINCATSGPAPEIPSYCTVTDVTLTSFDFSCRLLSSAPISPPKVHFELIPVE